MSNSELFDWGFKQQVSGDRPQESGNSLEIRAVEMKALLRDRRVIHAGEFLERFGWDERTCRAIAAASEGHILGTNEGYVLTERADPEEFNKANGRIYSQGRKMLRRAIQERRVRHQLVGGQHAAV
jgi:hypothetical protein